MKRLIIILLLTTYSFGSSENYELKLYEKILPSIFKKDLLVYTDRKSKKILWNSSILKFTPNCESADILIGKDFKSLPSKCKDKPIFSTSYRSFLNTTNSIGAFYWRKGRPQIKFNVDSLEKYDLKLPQSLIEFAQ